MFATTKEQQNLQTQMDEIQKGITRICKTASDERRDYTKQEIKQLDKYFEQLRNLKNREIEIQQKIAGAITQQASTTAEAFKGSLEEYKIQSQEWIATAEQQADRSPEKGRGTPGRYAPGERCWKYAETASSTVPSNSIWMPPG